MFAQSLACANCGRLVMDAFDARSAELDAAEDELETDEGGLMQLLNLTSYRTTKKAKTHSRWRSTTPVLRHAKAHAYLAALARIPQNVLRVAAAYAHLTDSRPNKPCT